MTRSPLRRFLDYTVLSVLAFIFVLPVLYLFLGSLKPSDEEGDQQHAEDPEEQTWTIGGRLERLLER